MIDNLFFEELLRRHANLDKVTAFRLSELWQSIHDRIVKRMLDICDQEVGAALHINAREDAILELAKFGLFLQTLILNENAKIKPLDQYDPADESASLQKGAEDTRIENTARVMADQVWKKEIERWRTKYPLIAVSPTAESASKLIKNKKIEFRKRMHYVPQSTTRPWACDKSGKFIEYRIGLDGSLRQKKTTAKKWAVEEFMYSQGLEHLLGLIEGDAKEAYRKLIDVTPLKEMDKRRWIAFLIAQYIRTPRFVRRLAAKLKHVTETNGHSFPTDPANLRRAFETLFQNNDLYAAFYRLIASRRWVVATASNGCSFLKGDNPIVITRRSGAFRLIYPLTPLRCFIAGPQPNDEPNRIIPHQRQSSDRDTSAINAAICAFAEHSVIGTVTQHRIDPTNIIRSQLGSRRRSEATTTRLWGIDWGSV